MIHWLHANPLEPAFAPPRGGGPMSLRGLGRILVGLTALTGTGCDRKGAALLNDPAFKRILNPLLPS